MNRITFKNVVPQVFSTVQDRLVSDIWQNELLFERGKHYLVEADSGRGKSTFCSYILGYRHDFSGQLLFDDKDTRRFSISEWTLLRECHVSCLFQELRLFPELTAFENVEIKNRLTHHKSRQQIEEWFDLLGIADKLQTAVGRLSFGQQQRVAMMRALVQPFDFLLADEPISHLDDANSSMMAALLTQETQAQGAALIVTSIGKRLPVNYDYTLRL